MKKVFLDMDGLIVDFVQYTCEFFNISNEFPVGEWDVVGIMCQRAKISQNEFWKRLDVEFWSFQPWMHDGLRIMAHLKQEIGIHNVCILSSPANSDSAAGKIAWIKRELPDMYKMGNFCLNRNKGFLAHPEKLLIDDGDHNIEAYTEHGGTCLLYPRKWNKRHPDAHRSLECFKDEFSSWIKTA